MSDGFAWLEALSSALRRNDLTGLPGAGRGPDRGAETGVHADRLADTIVRRWREHCSLNRPRTSTPATDGSVALDDVRLTRAPPALNPARHTLNAFVPRPDRLDPAEPIQPLHVQAHRFRASAAHLRIAVYTATLTAVLDASRVPHLRLDDGERGGVVWDVT